jgi:tRNA (adenine22-N1)-methyltransferase
VQKHIIKNAGKYYEILCFKKGEQTLNNKELYFGPILLKKKSEIFSNKWNEYLTKIIDLDSKLEEVNLIKEVLYEN